MISYCEQQGSILSVVHSNGQRTQFPCAYEVIGWDSEEICCISQHGEVNFFTATGENQGMYRIGMSKDKPISFTNGVFLYEDTQLGIKYAYNRYTGETRNASW